MLFYIFFFFEKPFSLLSYKKKQSRHRVFPKQLPSGLDVRVYSSLCGWMRHSASGWRGELLLFEREKKKILFFLFLTFYKIKCDTSNKFIWWRCHSVRRKWSHIYNPPVSFFLFLFPVNDFHYFKKIKSSHNQNLDLINRNEFVQIKRKVL